MNQTYADIKTRLNLERFIQGRTHGSFTSVGSARNLDECPFCDGHDCFRVKGDLWKCYQCDKGGDLFSFLEAQGMDKGEALKEAAKEAGVKLKKQAPPKVLSVNEKIMLAAAAHYSEALWQDGRAAYLKDKRGRTQGTLEAQKVGFADGRLAERLIEAGYKTEDIMASGLARANGDGKLRDLFPKGLFIYPHFSRKRVLHFTQKDPEKKVRHQLPKEFRAEAWRFYNQDALSKYQEIIVCEGENDVQAWMDLGVWNVIGIIGQISEDQIKALKNFCKGKTLYLCFDNDAAGQKYTRKVVREMASSDYHHKVISFDGAGDIDEFFKKALEAKEKVRPRDLLTAALTPVAWEVELAKALPDLETKLKSLKAQKVFERISEMVDAEQEVYVEKIVALGFTPKAVEGLLRTGGELRERVATYMANLNSKRDADPICLAGMIFKGFSSRGRWFYDLEDKCYLFHKHKIYQIGSNRAFNALMKKNTNLLPTQEPGRSVWESLASDCYNMGSMVRLMSWLHTDRKNDAIYINLNSDKNTILKLSPRVIEEIPNGTNADEVLLSTSKRIMPFNYLPDCKVSEGMARLKELIFDNLTCEVEQRYLIISWLMSAFLIDFAPYTALMKFSGSTASGKTTAARLLSLLIYGNEHLSDPTASAAYTVASQNPLLVIDNLESEDMTKALSRFLLLSATKGSKEKRAGGTDTDTIEESPKALVIITAIEPFTKPEQINRTYDMEFSTKYKRDEFVEDTVVAGILKDRDLILSAMLKVIACQTLPHLKRRDEFNIVLKKEYRGHAKERTNEYLALLMHIMNSLLKYINFYDEDEVELSGENGAREIWRRWIEYQDVKARDTEVGTNPMVTMLNLLWREYKGLFEKKAEESSQYLAGPEEGVTVRHEEYALKMTIIEQDGDKSVRFEATSCDLYAVFNKLSRNMGIKGPYKNTMQLGVRLKNDEKSLKQGGWELLTQAEGVCHWKIIHGARVYRFQKRLGRDL